MSLEPIVFRRAARPREAMPNALRRVEIIDTFGVEVVEEGDAVRTADLDAAREPEPAGVKTIPFASTLRHLT